MRESINPRPLSDREESWIRDILRVNDEWRDADIGKTQVVAEEPDEEGVSIRLQAPEPENPKARPVESVGQLWIQTDDGSTINVQLSQFEGHLRELYVLYIDRKHPKRKLPESWTEVSREVVNM